MKPFGRLTDAEKLYSRVRFAAPGNFDAFHLSGLLAFQQGRHADQFPAQALIRALP